MLKVVCKENIEDVLENPQQYLEQGEDKDLVELFSNGVAKVMLSITWTYPKGEYVLKVDYGYSVKIHYAKLGHLRKKYEELLDELLKNESEDVKND